LRIHYGLMDDLCSWEEFERLVEGRITESGDESDERSAAIGVVKDAGRLHTKISAIRAGPSLVSFFCRVIEVKSAEKFDRSDGGSGFVSRILCGDETGELILTLWDDKAFASAEISKGEILEVVGRFKRRGGVDVADLRKPENPEIICLRDSGMRTFSPVSIDCVILAFAGEGSFQASDGRQSKYIRIIAGDSSGEAEIMFWNNEQVKDLKAGDTVHISGMHERPSSGSKRSYSADEGSMVFSLPADPWGVVHKFSSGISEIHEGWSGSISVLIEDPGEVREFITRKGTPSHVRNLQVSDESGTATLVIWGEQACMPVIKGDRVEVFFAGAKEKSRISVNTKKSQPPEIYAGYGSFVSPVETGGRAVCIRGTIVPRNGYYSIDDMECCYPLKRFREGMRPCTEAEICGILYDSGRLEPDGFSLCGDDLSSLKPRLEEMKKRSGC